MTRTQVTRTYVKIPKGCRHAGRVCLVTAVNGENVTVFVPQKRRVLSPRIVGQALVEFPMASLSDEDRVRLMGRWV